MKKEKYIKCTFGMNEGLQYKLKEGINRVGRGYQMDICLSDDIQITRDNHCIVKYESEEDRVIVIPTVDSLTYLNNQKLEAQEYIKNGDVLRIGRSELTLCDG